MNEMSMSNLTRQKRLIFEILYSIVVGWFAFSTPASADATLDLSKAVPTLDQTFHSLPQWRKGAVDTSAAPRPLEDPSFSWTAGYIWDHALAGKPEAPTRQGALFPSWTSNGGAEASPNGDLIATLPPEFQPLRYTDTLEFIAMPMPAQLSATVGPRDPRDYLGATITSFPFAQTYGVFAITAKLPKGAGLWPAFWLLPADKSWPPEIDVMENIGRQPRELVTTAHTNRTGTREQFAHSFKAPVDLGDDFHEYALKWGPQDLVWYFDREEVFRQPTPSDMHQPFYIIANLAVGKPASWGGAPGQNTEFPAVMKVRSIKAWRLPSDAAVPRR